MKLRSLPFVLCAAIALSTCASCEIESFDTAETSEADEPTPEPCGPTTAIVSAVIDGDTVRLDTGHTIRYLLVDTPELADSDCYADEARAYNAGLVRNQAVTLTYDVECVDKYGRLLAYVDSVDGRVNEMLVAHGYACVLHIPPNGNDAVNHYAYLAREAKQSLEGGYSQCYRFCE